MAGKQIQSLVPSDATEGQLTIAAEKQLTEYGHSYSKASGLAIENIMEMAHILTDAHALLAGAGCKGRFRPWCEDLGIDQSTAYKQMGVLRNLRNFPAASARAGGRPHFGVKALYLLGSDKTPEEAREQAFAEAEAGPVTESRVKEIVKEKSPAAVSGDAVEEAVLDGNGREVKGSLAEAFRNSKEFDQHCRSLNAIKAWVREAADGPMGGVIGQKYQGILTRLENIRRELMFSKPFAVCPYCRNKNLGRECKACLDNGWVGKDIYRQATKGGN